jgi:hypothetical protein
MRIRLVSSRDGVWHPTPDRARAEMRDHVLTAFEALKKAQSLGTIEHAESAT